MYLTVLEARSDLIDGYLYSPSGGPVVASSTPIAEWAADLAVFDDDALKGVPPSKIHRFGAGTDRPEFTVKMFLAIKKEAQIRSNALEAARLGASKSARAAWCAMRQFTRTCCGAC